MQTTRANGTSFRNIVIYLFSNIENDGWSVIWIQCSVEEG